MAATSTSDTMAALASPLVPPGAPSKMPGVADASRALTPRKLEQRFSEVVLDPKEEAGLNSPRGNVPENEFVYSTPNKPIVNTGIPRGPPRIGLVPTDEYSSDNEEYL